MGLRMSSKHKCEKRYSWRRMDCAPRNSFLDEAFFFTTTFDRETKMILFRQHYRRWKPDRRCQESKIIWDLLDSGLGQDSTSWTTRTLQREKSKLVIAHLYKENIFFLHLFTQLVLQFYMFEDSKLRWSPLLHLRPWKDHLRSFRCNLQDFSLSLSSCSKNENGHLYQQD